MNNPGRGEGGVGLGSLTFKEKLEAAAIFMFCDKATKCHFYYRWTKSIPIYWTMSASLYVACAIYL